MMLADSEYLKVLVSGLTISMTTKMKLQFNWSNSVSTLLALNKEP